jgi:hypothetical protein
MRCPYSGGIRTETRAPAMPTSLSHTIVSICALLLHYIFQDIRKYTLVTGKCGDRKAGLLGKAGALSGEITDQPPGDAIGGRSDHPAPISATRGGTARSCGMSNHVVRAVRSTPVVRVFHGDARAQIDRFGRPRIRPSHCRCSGDAESFAAIAGVRRTAIAVCAHGATIKHANRSIGSNNRGWVGG